VVVVVAVSVAAPLVSAADVFGALVVGVGRAEVLGAGALVLASGSSESSLALAGV
jgi:hypothetical protein